MRDFEPHQYLIVMRLEPHHNSINVRFEPPLGTLLFGCDSNPSWVLYCSVGYNLVSGAMAGVPSC